MTFLPRGCTSACKFCELVAILGEYPREYRARSYFRMLTISLSGWGSDTVHTVGEQAARRGPAVANR